MTIAALPCDVLVAVINCVAADDHPKEPASLRSCVTCPTRESVSLHGRHVMQLAACSKRIHDALFGGLTCLHLRNATAHLADPPRIHEWAQSMGRTLVRLVQLRELTVSHCQLDNDDVVAVLTPAVRLPHLQKLGLSGNRMRTLPDALAADLGQLPLHTLELHNMTSDYGWPDIGWLIVALEQGRLQLRVLDLSRNRLDQDDADLFAALGQQQTSLQELDLSDNDLDCHMLVETLGRQRQLRKLRLGCCGNVGMLESVLGQLTQLEVLDLRENDIGPQAIAALAPALGQLSLLAVLDLSENDLRAQGVRALAPALSQLTRLSTLRLWGNECGPEGARALAAPLSQLSLLAMLDVSYNDLGRRGAQALAPALSQLTRLSRLQLYENHLGADGVDALAPALRQLPLLVYLGLAENELGVGGARVVAGLLGHTTRLQHLDLNANELGDPGTQALAPALGRLSLLAVLDLSDNKIGPDGVDALAASLAPLAHLTRLDMRHNPEIGEEGAGALATLTQLTQLKVLEQ